MKIQELNANEKFLFDCTPCKTFYPEEIIARVGRIELYGAEEFLFKSRENSFVFKITDSRLDFKVKNFLRKKSVGVATVSNIAKTATEKFFCLRIIFFTQAVRFNYLPIRIEGKLKSELSSFGGNFRSPKNMQKIFQFDDGINENCFAFSCIPTEKILILQSKEHKLLARVEGKNFESRVVADKIFSGENETQEFGLQIGYGEIEFSSIKPNYLPYRITEILFNIPSYIKVWNEYAELEGDFLLNRARAVGTISYNSNLKTFSDKVELTLIRDGRFDLSYVSVGDYLEFRTSPPPYIVDITMTWKEYQRRFPSDLKSELRCEIVKKDYKSLTIKCDEVFPMVGKLYYSITGDEKQIERRISARRRIETGTSALTNLGMILGSRLENSSQSTGIIFPARQKFFPLSPLLREKVFSKEPTFNQIQAIDIAINTPDIAVIQGPPGTGKTTVIAAILERLNEISDKNNLQAGQVLVTSLQHDAVQNVIDRISINSLPTIKFGRRTGEKEISPEESISKWRGKLLLDLKNKLDKQPKNISEVGKNLSNIVNEFYLELKNNPEQTEKIISAYNFAFAATAQQSDRVEIKRAKNLLRPNDDNSHAEYDTVIVDEAARITPGDLMIPMSQASRRIILVGDQRQLPHIYDEEIFSFMREDEKIEDEGDIKISMFEQLWYRAKELEKFDGIKRSVTLDSQFRMHPTLGKFISENFYDIYGEGFDSPRPASDFRQKISNSPACWVDVHAKHGKDFRASNKSLYRPYEASYIVKKLQEYLSDSDNDNLTFGVISFYRAQVQAIKREINLLDDKTVKKFSARVKIGTVDEFQGMEFDVMFLSVVRACRKFTEVDLEKLENPPPKDDEAAFAEYKKFVRNVGTKIYGFFNDNRLCVALSRQRKILIVVGESAMFNGKISARVAKVCVPAMYNFLQLCKSEGSLISV